MSFTECTERRTGGRRMHNVFYIRSFPVLPLIQNWSGLIEHMGKRIKSAYSLERYCCKFTAFAERRKEPERLSYDRKKISMKGIFTGKNLSVYLLPKNTSEQW